MARLTKSSVRKGRKRDFLDPLTPGKMVAKVSRVRSAVPDTLLSRTLGAIGFPSRLGGKLINDSSVCQSVCAPACSNQSRYDKEMPAASPPFGLGVVEMVVVAL